ncbi:MAG TPA: FAD-binding protein [Bacteroidales bacterium]|nr:FAD-binding protein [Bacteroidales bacterium]
MQRKLKKEIKNLKDGFEGALFFDELSKVVYATDASAYREIPFGVAHPKTKNDLKKLIEFAKATNITLIPRGAGTSLAGQVVGDGLVIDFSRYFNRILEVNIEERWVRVEPGAVLDELNNSLRVHNLFFAPETSTSNRCTIGGMVGNNSCGSHSLVYGSTREHLLETKLFLANNEEVLLKGLDKEGFEVKTLENSLEGLIYKTIKQKYSDKETQDKITDAFPEKDISRRNNGYALDELFDNKVFSYQSNKLFNLSKVFAGSEGTLGLAFEFKLNLMPLPPTYKALICAHFSSLEDSFAGNLIALEHKPVAIELMDDNVLQAAARNIAQKKNMFFIEGTPKAVLIIELAEETEEELDKKLGTIIANLKQENKGYTYPIIRNKDIKKVWELRKAGLGLLSNVPGSAKPVSVIEDTAVSPKNMAAYIKDFQVILKKYNLSCVYHAHIATGELHLRPILDLKKQEDVDIFHKISREVAFLVKKYRGSLSGEHGDGRLRGEYIPIMYSQEVYSMMKDLKILFDKNNIFNKGKIIDTPPMNTSLRYSSELGKKLKGKYNPSKLNEIKTYYSFEQEQGLLSAVEQCNGSSDCRKSVEFLNTMCPSYRATQDERYTPRARANALREFFTNPTKGNPFDNDLLYWILDNCLSCKGCKNECPSNVDIAKLKSEFLQHYYNANGVPLRILLINYLTTFQKVGSLFPKLYNWTITNKATSAIIKNVLKFSPKRNLPTLNEKTFRELFKEENNISNNDIGNKGIVYFFSDEFTNYQDSDIGLSALRLLKSLGYTVKLTPIRESGRIAISKGMVKRAKTIANRNISKLEGLINSETPLIGIEPSTILSFRDEYPSLIVSKNKSISKDIIENAFLIDEFLASEIDKGNIVKEDFTSQRRKILLHGHCQQKALIGTSAMEKVLSLPENYEVEVIQSGCCGMAGSFGYEEKHYEISQKIGNQILFPTILKAETDTIISAPGTSCRDHIKHSIDINALHPIQILWEARQLKSEE